MSGRKDLSLNTSLNSEGDDFMPEFTAKVKKAQQTLEKIKDNSQRMQEMQEKYSRATTSQQEKDLSRELDQIMMQNQQYSMQLKEVMSGISKDVDISKTQQPDEPETQMKITQQGALSIKVSDVLRVSQQVQVDYKASVREKMTRQTKHLDSTLSNEQVEEICNDPQKAEQLFQEKLYGQASVQMQNAVSDIQDKYKDIRKLEQSVQLVYQLIVDMALLVHTQGQMLDNIEMSLGSAKGYVGKAEKKLIEAKDDHQSARKKMCCLMLVGVIVIAIIVVPSVTMSKS